MNARQLTDALKGEARQLGFRLTGACPAVSTPGLAKFHDWLAAGHAGTMDYLPAREQAYQHPEHVLAGVRSLLMLGFPYRTAEPAMVAPGQGRVSRYAWGTDYHHLVRDRLHRLADELREWSPGALARGAIDTAPLLERDFARLAGLGWVGKNTLLLNREEGSWFFLAALLTDVELEYDAPHAADHCGTCRACLDACPTNAFPAPYVLDARRCISYLTIELRGQVPEPLRAGIGEWVFGCDICQEVCPWNRKAPAADEPRLEPAAGMNPLELCELFALDEQAFRQRFRHSPLARPRREGLLRNAAIVLGNQRAPEALAALERGLNDGSAMVRGACAWALGQYHESAAREALERRLTTEIHPEVRGEIEQSLHRAVQPAAAMVQ
ncbi:MAG TPA: tRNA epoxyqueuosine(34) reductase QueG [Pirellulales bacterium]|jgi:epoxyqueuosine reductase|nr:tRNA epoxyqueuosine(34) reductase QueG [Pirellulales bacterium]